MCVGREITGKEKKRCMNDRKSEICRNKTWSVSFFSPLRMTWRWTVGIGPDNLCRLSISMASQCATVKVRENGWTPPLIRGTLGGIRANTRTRTSVISSFLSAPLILLCRFFFHFSQLFYPSLAIIGGGGFIKPPSAPTPHNIHTIFSRSTV